MHFLYIISKPSRATKDNCVNKCVEHATPFINKSAPPPSNIPLPPLLFLPLPPHSTFLLPSPVAFAVDGNIVNCNLICLLPLPSHPLLLPEN